MRDESRALDNRKFKSLHDLVGRKAQIATTLSELLSENNDASVDTRLLAEVRTLQALANSNAVQIKALRDGVARARQSLEKIATGAVSAGVYGAHGRLLRSDNHGAQCRDA
ncbi:MAG: hypothetical protein ACKVS5_09125 [Parvularculaceae bacterium]